MKNLSIVVLFIFALAGFGLATFPARPGGDSAPGFSASASVQDDGWDEDKKKKKKKDGGEEDEEEYRAPNPNAA
jgi:hypothetical protein